MAVQQLSSAQYLNCATSSPIGGQSDGLFIERPTAAQPVGNIVAVRSSQVVRHLDRAIHCDFFEDFIGKALNITDAAWAVHDTSSAGTPTAAILGDADNGQFKMAFDNTNEAQVLGLYWNDEQGIDTDQGPIFHCRLMLDDLLDAADTLTFGLSTARNSTADSVTNNAWFRVETGGALLIESDDNTTDSDDKDTGVTLAVDTWYEFLIDCSNALDCKFYYRATLGGEWTALVSAGITFKLGADAAVQPNIQLQKSGGTQTTAILIDFVRLTWRRN